ncbi:MAG: toprim domain-containing protein [Candidatus Njordarchaeia archaeon]|nr:hypothetical protein [Candidatus Korarchaeota archaeon]
MKEIKQSLFNRFWKIWTEILGKDKLVIVIEGKHDEKVLKKLHFSGVIVKCQAHGIEKTIDKITAEKPQNVLILTDFDKAGELEARKLGLELESLGIKILNNYRNEFRRIFPHISRIEELNNLVDVLIDNMPSYIRYLRNIRNLKKIIDLKSLE